MSLRTLSLAAAVGFALCGAAVAAPVPAQQADAGTLVQTVKRHGWHGGHRGRHLGWHRGRHLGWYKHRHRHRHHRRHRW